MKQLIPKILKFATAGICLILLLLSVIPSDNRIRIQAAPMPTGESTTRISEELTIIDTKLLDWGVVSELFGWIRPTPTPTPPPTGVPTIPAKPTCIPAGYLRFITKFKDEKDVVWYIFRNVKNNTQIKVAKNIPDQGWSLVTEGDTFFTFIKNREMHCVPK